jgi:hypothetical protein
VGNGWYRVSLTYTSDTATSLTIRSFPYVGSTQLTGDGFSGLLVWGAQLEAGAFATSYIPTTTAQVTRSADAASMTGTNFSSWYRADEGTLYAEASVIALTTDAVTVSINNGTTGNDIRLRALAASSSLGFRVFDSGVSQASVTTASTLSANVAFKQVGTYKVNDFAFVPNGGAVVTDTSGTVPSAVTQLTLGGLGTISLINGSIKKFAYYPKRLTNAELQGLTTI